MPTSNSKVAVVTKCKAPVEIWSQTVPSPPSGCINIRVDRAGVCGTDVHLWRGDGGDDLEPFVLGHEGVGTIVELGEGVTTDHASYPVAVGDVVYWNPIRPCHSCFECTVQRDLTGCPNGEFFSPASLPTTWASYAQIATLQRGNAFYKVDKSVPCDAFIALGCALPTMLQALEHLGPIEKDEAVLVQGCGAVGLASIMLARMAGARKIIAIDGNPLRLDMARRFGANETLDLQSAASKTQELRAKRVHELTGPRGLSLAIECTGRAEAMEEGLPLLARNGRYLCVGTWAGSGVVAISPFQIVRKALKIIGTTYASPENYFQAARLVEQNHHIFPLAECVTHRFSLEDTERAFEVVASGKAIKAVVEPQTQE
ncbi:5-exo-hydroxycamphor dehydrogenase [Cyphellophora attinorum]|uniref:5-exo-hydroxycamphor dehydrogenase n=1 Tax=Cyphellophora attinorum TaxID=1664694 RepID=A0A0N0NMT8_9EURO|nr:5-exo-hydroxycamphor dehydrogenase [Phialophora attinorum]KPI40841.1 5-exo-hydroxycamphor dehydrogenase [Phialophora attinorum]